MKDNPKISAKKLLDLVGIYVKNISKLKEMKVVARIGGTRVY